MSQTDIRAHHSLIYRVLWYLAHGAAVALLRPRIEGMEHIPKRGGALICPNHITWMDPPLMAALIRRPVYFITKREAFVPVVGRILEMVGAYPVDRSRADRSAIWTTTELVRRGDMVLLFPEGTRSRTGELGRPREGAAKIAKAAGVPVIPVGIRGPYRLFGGLEIRVGAPMMLEPEHTAADVMKAISALIERR